MPPPPRVRFAVQGCDIRRYSEDYGTRKAVFNAEGEVVCYDHFKALGGVLGHDVRPVISDMKFKVGTYSQQCADILDQPRP